MGYDLDPISANCYPGTSILENKFDIHDESKLNEVEAVVVSARNAEWLEAPSCDAFDFEHYKSIHRFLFSDLYDWAGEIRTVNISKKGTQFCPADRIGEQATLIFNRLKECNFFCGLPHKEYVDEIVDFYCATNDLHPFREGNGRTQRAFLTQLVKLSEYDINFSEIDTELLMIATIRAANGVTDLLRELFDGSVQAV